MNGYGMIRTVGVVVLLVAASVLSGIDAQRPPLLTDDDLASLLHTAGNKFPPLVISPGSHTVAKPADRELRVRFNDFGKAMNTYLNPSEGQLIGENTPVWLAFTKPDGTIEYKKMAEDIVGKVTTSFFTNAKNLSTFAVYPSKSGDPSFDGKIDDLIIRPMPESPRKEGRSRRDSEAPNTSRTTLDIDDHLIIKSTAVTEQVEKLREASRSVEASRVKRSTQETIYPSLLVQTDFKRVRTTYDDANYYDEIIYQIAFWNAVDFRFRQAKDPKIRLRIAGIIIGLDRMATLGKLAADKTEALDELAKYWYKMSQRKDFPLEAYDIVMTMTDSEMYRNQGSMIGIGEKSFCTPPSEDKYRAVGIFRDDHVFNGVLHAAYSLGSIFGLSPDTESGDDCDVSNGFIMRPDDEVGPHYMEWSPCSLKSLSVGLRKSSIDCSDKPAEFYPPGRPVQKPLPGDILSPDQQCKARGFDGSCGPSADMCTDMECYKASGADSMTGRRCEVIGPAAEGTTCSRGRKCMDGVCACVSAQCMYCQVDDSSDGTT